MDTEYSTLFSGEKEDRVEDDNLEVLRRMDDVTLSNFCRSSLYYKGLCEQIIWLERINAVPGLSLLLPYRSHYEDLEDFYLNVRNDAQYVVSFEQQGIQRINYVSNDIRAAHALVIERFIQAYPTQTLIGMSNDEIISLLGKNVPVRITVRFDNVLDYDNLDDYTIYSVLETSRYQNPNILSYPLLTPRDVYVAVEYDAGEIEYEPTVPHFSRNGMISVVLQQQTMAVTKYSFIKYNTESLRRINKMGNNILLFHKLRDDSPLADYYVTMEWTKYGFLNIEDDGPQILLLVDNDMLELAPTGYQAVIIKGINIMMFNENKSRFGASLRDMLTMTPEQLQQRNRDNFISIVQDGQMIQRDQLLFALRSFH